MLISLTQLRPNPYQRQVRTTGLDAEHVRKLARSMRDNYDRRPDMRGLYQPVLVREDPGEPGAYQVGDGHHRWDAARLLCEGDGSDEFPGDARWSEIPVLVEEIAGEDMLLMAVDTAMQHKGLSPMDMASAFKALNTRPPKGPGLTQKAIGARYGLSQSSVANTIRLLRLPKPVRKLIGTGTLTEKHGRALLRLIDVPGRPLDFYVARHGKGLWSLEEGEWNSARSITETPVAPNSKLFVTLASFTEGKVADLLRDGHREFETGRYDAPQWTLDWKPLAGGMTTDDVEAMLQAGDGYSGLDAMRKKHLNGVEHIHMVEQDCATCPHRKVKDDEATCEFGLCFDTRRQLWRESLYRAQVQYVHAWCETNGVAFDDEDAQQRFDYSDAILGDGETAGLVAGGHCKPGECDCMAIRFLPPGSTWRIRDGENLHGPDREHAPDFYFVCTSSRKRKNKLRKLARDGVELPQRDEYTLSALKRTAARAAIREMSKQFQAYIEDDAERLAQNQKFLRTLCGQLHGFSEHKGQDEPTSTDGWWRWIAEALFARTCYRPDEADDVEHFVTRVMGDAIDTAPIMQEFNDYQAQECIHDLVETAGHIEGELGIWDIQRRCREILDGDVPLSETRRDEVAGHVNTIIARFDDGEYTFASWIDEDEIQETRERLGRLQAMLQQIEEVAEVVPA
jgi:ParB/RepB/Spo0J family partition protein